MSTININVRNVISASAKINAAKKEAASARMAIRGTTQFIDTKIRSQDNLDARLNRIYNEIRQIENQMGRISNVVTEGANRYQAVENEAVWKAKKMTGVNKQITSITSSTKDNRKLFKMASISVTASGVGALEPQKKINRWVESRPKTLRNLVKVFYKKVTKGTTAEGSGKAYGILAKIADGKYVDALGNFVNEVNGQMYSTNSRTGNAVFNWNAVKVQAAVGTIKTVLDSDGYIVKNKAKYEEMAVKAVRKGDIAGCVGIIAGEFVQTVGKGSVDVLCQTAGSFFDSTLSMATGGMLTLSSVNDLMYDVSGVNPKEMFHSITNGISKGVDFAVDKGIIQGASNLQKLMGKAFSTTTHSIGSLFE